MTQLRADAARNREKLLDSARELFNERGLDVTLNDIAHHAGVGVGTAYRRFADKYEVLDALYEQRIEQIEAVGREALALADPWRCLTTYLEKTLAIQGRDRALAQILSGARVRPEQHDRSRDRLAPINHAIADRAREAGVVRPGFQGTDIVFFQVGLNAIAGLSRARAPELARRYLWLWLDGIRTDGQRSDLPVPPLSLEDTHRIMGGR